MPPKPQTWRGLNRYLTQSRLQVKGCTAERYCLLRVIVQGPASFLGRSTLLYDVRFRSYGASKLPNFQILAFSMLHYCERLNKLEAETLEMRRLKLDLVMYYNILHGFVDIDAGSLFVTINCNVIRSRGHPLRICMS